MRLITASTSLIQNYHYNSDFLQVDECLQAKDSGLSTLLKSAVSVQSHVRVDTKTHGLDS